MQKRSNPEEENRDRQDPLTDLIRTRAQQLIVQALKVEVADLLATYADQRDEQGHARVVLSGHQPTRDIHTGIGLVTGADTESPQSPGGPSPLSFRAGPAVCAQDLHLRSSDPMAALERHFDRRDPTRPGSARGA